MPKNYNITAEAPEEVTYITWGWVFKSLADLGIGYATEEGGSDESYEVTIFSHATIERLLEENQQERIANPEGDGYPPDPQWIPIFQLSDDQSFHFWDNFYIRQDGTCTFAEEDWGRDRLDGPMTLPAALRSIVESGIMDEPQPPGQ